MKLKERTGQPEAPLNIGCRNEYGTLRSVLLCPPSFMRIREVINETQKHFADENINTALAMRQYAVFKSTLEMHGVRVYELPADKQFPEQVFTRDVGFTIGGSVYCGVMKRSVRQGETLPFIEWLAQHQIEPVRIEGGSIEGGDVILDGDTVWVGDSDRTSSEAVRQLSRLLPKLQVRPVCFDPDYLHLDCVFNPVSRHDALIYPPALAPESLQTLQHRYRMIEIEDEEQFRLAANVVSIGSSTLTALPFNEKTNTALRRGGYRVIEVDISEIIKSGGSFRCITLPLQRD